MGRAVGRWDRRLGRLGIETCAEQGAEKLLLAFLRARRPERYAGKSTERACGLSSGVHVCLPSDRPMYRSLGDGQDPLATLNDGKGASSHNLYRIVFFIFIHEWHLPARSSGSCHEWKLADGEGF
jgi:hypothetical protein